MSRGKCHRFPSGPPYGVCISQLITLKKCTTVLSLSQLIDLIMSQGYTVLRLENLFKKFYDRYHDLIEKYQRSVKEIVNDSFPWYNLLYIQRDFSDVFIILHRFVTWVCQYFISLIGVLGVMHKADNAYSVPSTWSCYWLDQFLTPAYSTRTLSKKFAGYFLYYIAHFTGC